MKNKEKNEYFDGYEAGYQDCIKDTIELLIKLQLEKIDNMTDDLYRENEEAII